MNWITIYITGRPEFKEEVKKKLDHSHLNFMPGNIGTPADTMDDLYWLDSTTDLRAFKEAIGGKLIWKYRLRFFASLEEFLEFKDRYVGSPSNVQEQSLMEEMPDGLAEA